MKFEINTNDIHGIQPDKTEEVQTGTEVLGSNYQKNQDTPLVAQNVEQFKKDFDKYNSSRNKKLWTIRGAGAALILVALVFIGIPLLHQAQTKQNDVKERIGWDQAVKSAAILPKGTSTIVKGLNPGDYALITFPSLGNIGVVAGNGDWSVLTTRPAAHWKDTPAPGEVGNSLIGFHREPLFKDVDKLKTGDLVNVQTNDGKTHVYKLTSVKVVHENDTTDLKPISDGNRWLTLITCTPWYQDYERLIMRGQLVS